MSQSTEEMRPSKMWRTLPTDLRVSASPSVLVRRAGRARAGGSHRAHRRPSEVPAQERPGAVDREEGAAPGRHGASVGSAGGAVAGVVSPRASASDDGRVSRRARHRARGRAHQGRVAEGARRRNARPRGEDAVGERIRRPMSPATSGRCSGRILKRGEASRTVRARTRSGWPQHSSRHLDYASVRTSYLRLLQSASARSSARLLRSGRVRCAAKGLQEGAGRARLEPPHARQPRRMSRSVRARAQRRHLPGRHLVWRRHRRATWTKSSTV